MWVKALAELFSLESRYILGEHIRCVSQGYLCMSPAKDTGDFSCPSLWEPDGAPEIKSVIVQRLSKTTSLQDLLTLKLVHVIKLPFKCSCQIMPPAASALLNLMSAGPLHLILAQGCMVPACPACNLHSLRAPGRVADFLFIQPFPCCSGRYDDPQVFTFWSCMAQCFTWQCLNISALFHP